jgi:hypothetical protein
MRVSRCGSLLVLLLLGSSSQASERMTPAAKKSLIDSVAKKFSKPVREAIRRTSEDTHAYDMGKDDAKGVVHLHTYNSMQRIDGRKESNDFHVTLTGKKLNNIETVQQTYTEDNRFRGRSSIKTSTVTIKEKRHFPGIRTSTTTIEDYRPGSDALPREIKVKRDLWIGGLRVPLRRTYSEGF